MVTFPALKHNALPIYQTESRYPVRRIFCIGRNYAAHAAEMGNKVDRDAPFFFTKSPHHISENNTDWPYPPGTSDLHHEVELVAAVGSELRNIAEADALDGIWGYAVGLDMTRRDLQARAKEKRHPWDVAKDFEGSAIFGALRSAKDWGNPSSQNLSLTVNGTVRQSAPLSDMVWSLPEIVAYLSSLYVLGVGDLIMTGTPAGVGPVDRGDILEGQVDGLPPVRITIV